MILRIQAFTMMLTQNTLKQLTCVIININSNCIKASKPNLYSTFQREKVLRICQINAYVTVSFKNEMVSKCEENA